MILDEIGQKRREINEQIKNSRILKEESLLIEKNKKNNTEEEDDYESMYYELLNVLDLENENYKEDPKYIKLLEGLSKKR